MLSPNIDEICKRLQHCHLCITLIGECRPGSSVRQLSFERSAFHAFSGSATGHLLVAG